MATQFIYSQAQDFSGQKVAIDSLESEIRDSAITIALESVGLVEDECTIVFKTNLSAEEESLLDSIIIAHEGEELTTQVPALTSAGVALVQMEPSEKIREEQYSIDFCDKTTWYYDSVRVKQEALVDSGDHVQYHLADPCYVVNPHHGDFFGAHELIATHGVVVTVNDIVKTLVDINGQNGDFHLDFTTGNLTFSKANNPTDIVKMTYSKVQSSLCKIIPPAGKTLTNTHVELNISADIQMHDDVRFEYWGLVDRFRPDLIGVDIGWGVLASGDKIPLVSKMYRTLFDFVVSSEKSYPVIPPFQAGVDADNPRHFKSSIYLLRFDYMDRGITKIEDATDMEVRIQLVNNKAFDGEHAVATFYCVK